MVKEGIRDRGQLLGKLKETQAEKGCVSESSLSEISTALGVRLGEAYGVSTFYSFLSLERLGRHVIRICKSVPCCLKDGEEMIGVLEELLGIGVGETTSDERFTLEVTNCIGACDQAPAMLVDDTVYGDLSREKISEILRSYD